jgi:hypothetical protein
VDLDDLAEYVTIRTAAQRLSTTPNAVYFYLRHRGIPTRRAGRTILLRLYDLREMRVPAGDKTWQTR